MYALNRLYFASNPVLYCNDEGALLINMRFITSQAVYQHPVVVGTVATVITARPYVETSNSVNSPIMAQATATTNNEARLITLVIPAAAKYGDVINYATPDGNFKQYYITNEQPNTKIQVPY